MINCAIFNARLIYNFSICRPHCRWLIYIIVFIHYTSWSIAQFLPQDSYNLGDCIGKIVQDSVWDYSITFITGWPLVYRLFPLFPLFIFCAVRSFVCLSIAFIYIIKYINFCAHDMIFRLGLLFHEKSFIISWEWFYFNISIWFQ